MKIAVIDDADEDRAVITGLIRQYFQENYPFEPVIIEQFDSGEQFIDCFSEGSYGLIFIDYFLNQMNGLDTARGIRQKDPSVFLIFITISRDFAIDCYKVHASDYLVKPLTYKQLSEALSLINLTLLQSRQYILVTCGREQIRILLKDIIYCDASGHYVQIHTQSSSILRSRISFAEFVRKLEPYPQFLLCYRGCLVNMDQIIRIENMDFLMNGGDHIPMRQKEHTRLMKAYYNYIFSISRSCK